MSDELQQRLKDLEAENRRLLASIEDVRADLKEANKEARDRRHELKALAEERDNFALLIQEVEADRDEWQGRANTDPEGLNARISELTGTVRSMKHERAFDKVLGTLNVKDPAKRADLLRLVDYKAEADDPDEAAIASAFGEALKSRPWYTDAEPAPTTQQPAAGAAPTVPGGTQSGAPTDRPGATPAPGSDRGQSLSDGGITGRAQQKVPGRF